MQPRAGINHVANASLRDIKPYFPFRGYATFKGRTPLRSQHVRVLEQHPSPGLTKVDRRSRNIPWILGGIMAGSIGLYIGALCVAASKTCQNPAIKELAGQKDVAGRYGDTADNFDSDVGMSEVLMGINRIRKQLARQAVGHVLEVSCGTGRNIGYFDLRQHSPVKSLTFVDLAPQMIDVCKKKWQALVGNKGVQKKGFIVRFLPASALGQMPLAPSNDGAKKYDTIIQTMGLCSTSSPVQLLENMTRHLDTDNPDARIFLLEHGRSYQQWLNNILDSSAEKHAEIHGCWFNRDIGALVEEAAAKAGLDMVSEKRHHLGTTWVFELKPSKKSVEQQHISTHEPQEEKASRWFSWYK